MNFQFSIFNFQKRLIQAFVYSLIGLFAYSLIPAGASAAGCTPIYGGGPTCTDNTLAIQKMVLNPSTNKFVHNLGSNDPKYQAGDMVTFHIVLTNNGSNQIQKTIVKDELPTVLTFASGPGEFDKSTSMLTFEVDNLAPHHSQVFMVTAYVASQSTFGAYDCVTNTVSALPSVGAIAQDSSELCLGKLTTTPATGAETLGLIALLPTALIGLGLKKLRFN